MHLRYLSKVEERIIEIKKEVAGKEEEISKKVQDVGVTQDQLDKLVEKENKPLLVELEELTTKRQFWHDWKQLAINLTSILIALGIAFGVPIWQTKLTERHNIQSLYQAIDANEDIFISNYSEFKNELNKGLPLTLPQTFIDFPLDENVYKTLQKKFGIDLYRYLLFYFNQTKLLNELISKIRSELADSDLVYPKESKIAQVYWANLDSLDKGGWKNSKFNYIHDSSCLEYIFIKTFPFLEISERSKTTNCSSESLNRIFYHYGYVESEMPKWIRPELRAALNEREAGLGDSLINYQ